MSIRPTVFFQPVEAQDFMHSSSYDLCMPTSKPPQQNPSPKRPKHEDVQVVTSSYDLCLQGNPPSTPPSKKDAYQVETFLNIDGPSESPTHREASKAHVSASQTFLESFSPRFGAVSPDLYC
jgi:hypothetical protein